MCEDTNAYKERVSNQNWRGHCKCLVKTKNLFGLEIHCSSLTSNNSMYFSDFLEVSDIKLYNITSQNLHINHYQHMSLEYYTNIKMIRGGGQRQNNHGHYNLNRFNDENKYFNVVSDCELYNKKYLQN